MPSPPWKAWKVVFPLPNKRDEDYVDTKGFTTSEFLFKICHTFPRWQPVETPFVFDDMADLTAKKRELMSVYSDADRAGLHQPDRYAIRELASWWVNHKTKKVDRELKDDEADVQLGLYCAILHAAKKAIRDSVNQGELMRLMKLEQAEEHERNLDKSLQENEDVKKFGLHGVRAVDINNMLRDKPTRDKKEDVRADTTEGQVTTEEEVKPTS
ncbi:Nn.00g025160.m01.CDS01 [Neocucurbitaria sp. VM-36]